jgi:hypothetical protein
MGQEQPGNPNQPGKGLEVDPGGLDKEEINLNPSPGPEKEIPQPIEPQPGEPNE